MMPPPFSVSLNRFHGVPSPGMNAFVKANLFADDDEQFEAFGGLHPFTLQMPVNAFDRLAQLALTVGLEQAAYGNVPRARIGMAGRKQRRNAFLLGCACEMDAGLLLL